MDCKCTAHVSYRAAGNTMKAILDKIDFCPLHAAAPELKAALEAADEAINPSDRRAISLHEWNGRLKLVTLDIRDALAKAKGLNHDAQSQT